MKTIERLIIIIALTVMGVLATQAIFSPKHSHEARSRTARAAFERSHPCPANGHSSGACPGYVVDHILPLACGGADAPSNMQWQTVADGKAKDKWERKDCAATKKYAEEEEQDK